jgi:nitroreductase
LSQQDQPALEVGALMGLIKNRRSIRQFKPDPIPRGMLEQLLEAMRWAPSAANQQPWFFYAVNNREKIQELAAATHGQDFVADAPLVFVVCADPARSEKMLGSRGRDFYCYQDTALAAQNLALTAAAAGMGTCWVGSFDEGAIRMVLDIPPHLRPVAVIPCGWPVAEPETPHSRRGFDEVCRIL